MSKKGFNPYRDLLDIPSLTDEKPTDYQLLGVEDFESDSDKIAAAHEKRSQRIAELYQLITKLSQQIDDARDRISDSNAKEEYDNNLRITGRAGVPHLGWNGVLAILFSFLLSVVIVVVSFFYIYPRIAPVSVENVGDSVATLPDYNESQSKKELDILKEQQQDITTMDVNVNLPIDADEDITVEFTDVPAENVSPEDSPVGSVTDLEASLPENAPAVEEPAVPEETALPEEAPAVEEPTVPEDAAVPEEAPAVEEPAAPEETALPEEVPAIDEPAAPEETVNEEPVVPEAPDVNENPEPAPETPDLPSIPEAPEVPEIENAPVEPPAVDIPEVGEPASPEAPEIETVTQPDSPTVNEPEPAVAEPEVLDNSAVWQRPAFSGARPDSDTPTVPKMADLGNSGIPELPPMDEELAASDLPIAPQPPVIPELSGASDVPEAPQPPAISELSASVQQPAANLGNRELGIGNSNSPAANLNTTPHSLLPTPSTRAGGIELEDVDVLDQIVMLGQKARTDVDFAQLLSSARQVEADLLKKKDFQKAQQIADAVYESCARSADKTYRSEAYRYKEFISRRSAWWDSVSAAEAKMETNGSVSPTDAALVAQWKIEIENDWETGLKYLAYSDNEQIQLAVKRDLAANPENVRHCLVVANDWWNLSQDPVPMQKQYRQRASMWYSKALPSIADKQIRTLVEKRISMVDQGFSKN